MHFRWFIYLEAIYLLSTTMIPDLPLNTMVPLGYRGTPHISKIMISIFERSESPSRSRATAIGYAYPPVQPCTRPGSRGFHATVPLRGWL